MYINHQIQRSTVLRCSHIYTVVWTTVRTLWSTTRLELPRLCTNQLSSTYIVTLEFPPTFRKRAPTNYLIPESQSHCVILTWFKFSYKGFHSRKWIGELEPTLKSLYSFFCLTDKRMEILQFAAKFGATYESD